MVEIDLLLVGGEDDFNIRHLLKQAQKHNIKARHCLTGEKDIPKISLDIHNNIFTANDCTFTTKAMFIRPDVTTYPKTKNLNHHALASDWFNIFLGWCLANDNIKILNREYFVRNKVNKVANLLIAKKIGIHVPETYFTNDIGLMNECHGEDWIEKPVTGGEHTKLLSTQDKITVKENISIKPITLQKKMVKPELRFFRVGTHYRAFTMNSKSLDYRENQDAVIDEVPFPEEHKEKFIQLTDILGLDFAAADYITNPETNELTFLEVNSGPMFTAFDMAANGALCGDIFKTLLE